MVTATYTISGIKDEMQLMQLSGVIAAWMMGPDREATALEAFAAHDENGEPV